MNYKQLLIKAPDMEDSSVCVGARAIRMNHLPNYFKQAFLQNLCPSNCDVLIYYALYNYILINVTYYFHRTNYFVCN